MRGRDIALCGLGLGCETGYSPGMSAKALAFWDCRKSSLALNWLATGTAAVIPAAIPAAAILVEARSGSLPLSQAPRGPSGPVIHGQEPAHGR